MVLLFCVAVGAVGDAFSVEINEAKKVYYLSEAIRTAKANELKDVDACQLELYLAKKDKGHGAWLTKEEAADVRYESVPQEFKPMRTTRYLNASEYLGEDFQPGEGHVHVLALYPTNLHIRMNDQYPEVISSYMEVADRLKETEEVKALSTHLANISVKNDAFTPFVVLENSSGTGKTQMAFNLQVRGECEVFYIVCGTFGLGTQRVYRPYEKRSKAFQNCLEKDLKAMEAKKFGNGEPIGSVGDFRRSTTLALYSFILAALRGRDVVIGTASRSDVYAEVARRKERGAKPFVFFLDEFPRARHIKSCFDNDDKVKSGEYQRELENELRMTRNVFLSLGLTVVACSTNGSGKNLFVTGSHSRGGEPSLWCVVFPSLPRVNITIDSEIPVLLKEIIKHSRPLFAEIALKHVQDHPCGDNSDICSYLDEMAGALASGFRMLKRTGSEFKIGQLCLLLCSSCHVQDIKVDIIDRHYARLPEQSAFKLYLSGNGLIKDDDFWTCRAVPPSPSEDLLLHLTMMGGLSSRPFKKPMHRVMSKIHAPFYYDKSDQRSSEGIRLEELTTASIVLASHVGGFGGVSFPAFLGGLLYELGVNEQAKMVQLLQDVEHAGWTRIVPFLSPPTAEWPEWMNDNSMRFGNLVRTRTYDRIELQARSNSISGGNEEKSSTVDAGVMKSILMCVPNEPMVHLVLMDTLRKRHVTGEVAAEPRIHVVVTNSLQTGSFPDGLSWETFVHEQSLQNVDFYRISEGSTLQEIEGMTNRSKTEVVANKKLVLFIELGKKYPSGQ